MDFTPQAESKMKAWLEKDKQKAKVGHRYNLQQFGLTENDLEREFADYLKLYNVNVD